MISRLIDNWFWDSCQLYIRRTTSRRNAGREKAKMVSKTSEENTKEEQDERRVDREDVT
jgi:hypothetical protein